MPNLHARVVEFVSDVLQVEIPAGVSDLNRNDCDEWDSVNHLRLIMEIEDVFGIVLDDEQGMDLSSLRQIEALLLERGAISPGEAAG